MTGDEMKALARRMYAAANAGDIGAADGIFAADFCSHPMGTTGVDAVKQAWSSIRAMYPDLHVTAEDMLADGDRLAVRVAVHGIPADRRGAQEPALMEIMRMAGGRITELWGVTNLSLR